MEVIPIEKRDGTLDRWSVMHLESRSNCGLYGGVTAVKMRAINYMDEFKKNFQTLQAHPANLAFSLGILKITIDFFLNPVLKI